MSVLNQKTIKKSIHFSGIGLHSGKKVNLDIHPAAPNTGIVFKRTDIKNNNIILPNVFNVSNASFCTTITNESGLSVSTIEHLMGAFYGVGIDNALVEINNQEVPILDGSAKIFVEKILSAGIKTSDLPIKIIKIEKDISFSIDKKRISIKPSKLSLDIDFEIKYQNPLIRNQRNNIDVFKSELDDIFNSRTFCLFEDIEKLRAINLGLGGSLENAIVVKDDQILNDEKLRNDKEFVNHKILDLAGDFLLSGYRIIGKVVCYQGGHELTNKFLRKLFNNKSSLKIFENKNITFSKNISLKQSSKIAINA